MSLEPAESCLSGIRKWCRNFDAIEKTLMGASVGVATDEVVGEKPDHEGEREASQGIKAA